jgi:pimeloyl-ACP methyl ester carboxylesterase
MTRTPVVFIHGLWLHATSWAPWVEVFGEAGYDPDAPGWPGDPDTVEAARANPDSIADHGIEDVTSHYAGIIDKLPARPILIGHSFGGMLAEKLLGLDYGAAAIGIDAAQVKGVLPLPLSALHSTLPVFKNPGQQAPGRLPHRRAVPLQLRQCDQRGGIERDARAVDDPGAGQALVRGRRGELLAALAGQGHTANEGRGPLLLIMGGQDHTVPEVITKATVKQYRHSPAVTDLEEFGDRGHSLTIDSGWRDVADVCLAWLGKQGL